MESCAFNIFLLPLVGANLCLAVLEVALSVALVHADAGDVGFLAALRGSLGVRKYVARAPAAKRSTYTALQRFFHKSCLLCCRFEQRWVLLARCYYLALLYFGYPGLVVLFYRSHPTIGLLSCVCKHSNYHCYRGCCGTLFEHFIRAGCELNSLR